MPPAARVGDPTGHPGVVSGRREVGTAVPDLDPQTGVADPGHDVDRGARVHQRIGDELADQQLGGVDQVLTAGVAQLGSDEPPRLPHTRRMGRQRALQSRCEVLHP